MHNIINERCFNMKKPLLSEMTLREKIGQCLLVYQYEINQDPETNY